MLLWACEKYCCCTYNMNNPHSIDDATPCSRSIQGDLGKVEGFWSASECALIGYRYRREQISCDMLLMNERMMHLYDDDIIMSYWVRSIELRVSSRVSCQNFVFLWNTRYFEHLSIQCFGPHWLSLYGQKQLKHSSHSSFVFHRSKKLVLV